MPYKIEIYEATDGQRFDVLSDACQHELDLFGEFLQERMNDGEFARVVNEYGLSTFAVDKLIRALFPSHAVALEFKTKLIETLSNGSEDEESDWSASEA